MTWKLGATDVTDVYLGTTALSKLYVGTTEVWSPSTGVTVGAVAFSTTGFYRTDGSTLDGTDMTWAGWFKASTVTGAYHSFLSASASGSAYFISSVNSSGVLVQDNNPTGEYTTGYSFPTGVWHYVAVAHHESSGAMEFYYGLEADAVLTKVTFTGSTGPSSGYFQIGSDFFAAHFQGSAAQVKVWTAALTEAELNAEWQKASVVHTSGLWGYWSFNSGPQTTDESGGGHTLTVMNSGDPLTSTTGPTITDTTPAGPTTLFTETWTGADSDPWDATRWPNQRPSTSFINTNKGVLAAGSPSQCYCSLTVTDFECLIKAEWQVTIGGQYPEIAWRIGANVTSGTGSNGYVMQINGTSGQVDIFKVSAYTSIANATDATLNAIGIRWFRVRVVGDRHQVRWWTDGGSEPGTWQIDVTDSTYTTGAFGLRAYVGSSAFIWDDLTITTP